MALQSSSVLFDTFPNEIGVEIFAHLELGERLKTARISRLFKDLAYDPVSFNESYKKYNDDESSIKEIQTILREARSLGIDLTQVTYENIKNVKAKVENIKKDSIIKIWKKIQSDNPGLDYPDFTQLKDETCSAIIEKFDVWTKKNKDNISSLHLDSLNLKYLPDSIGNLSNLKELNLYNNKIRTLPETLGNLSNLKELSLNNNQISTLPVTLGNLSKLEWLNLNNNQISTLPVTLGNLSNLKELNLYNNKIRTLPETLGNLSKLEWLY
ncbi:MAG TPA: hypothetical protein ENH96_01160, partial [Chlamydiae bacterium]|nr:hypothetical protein [Chlamydiota bacterium]